MTQRRRLPDRRTGWTHNVKLDGQSLYLQTGEYADGALGEIFVRISKAGSTLQTMTDSWAKGVSYALQYGCPLETIVNGWVNVQCSPCGEVTGHPDIVRALSVQDLCVRMLALHYLGRRDLANAPVLAEPAAETVVDEPLPALGPVAQAWVREGDEGRRGQAEPPTPGGSGQTCTQCGSSRLQRSGTCFTCQQCGSTSGCS